MGGGLHVGRAGRPQSPYPLHPLDLQCRLAQPAAQLQRGIQVDVGTTHVGEVTQSFQQIIGLIGKTTEAAREIELSTKQQASAVEQVKIAIASTAQATKETEVSSGQTFQTAAQLVALSKDLQRLVQPQAVSATPG